MKTIASKKFWQTLAVKSQVTLTDTAALEASQLQGRGLQGMEYVVEEILHVVENDNLCEWFICRIVNPDQELYLVAKLFASEVQLKVYYAPPAVISGTRQEQIEAANTFIFRDAKDMKQYMHLKHAALIDWDFNIDEKVDKVRFLQKGNIELTGKGYYQGDLSVSKIGQPLLVTISEYLAQKQCSDPEIMIFEVGSYNSKVGGVIKVLLGAPVNEFEVSILNAKKSPIVSGSSGLDARAYNAR